MRKLLIVGSNTIHTYNYIDLIKGYFDTILLITNEINPKYEGKSIVLNFSFKNPLTVFTTLQSIKWQISSYNPSLIHIHQAGTMAFITLMANKEINKPVVLTAWGSDILYTPKKGILYKKMLQYILKNAGILTSDSLFMASEMQKYVPDKNLDITIANFGININIDSAVSGKKENIIYSNRLHKSIYRIDLIIDLFSKFVATEFGKDWKLIIAGNGEETNNLKKQVDILNIRDNVYFAGWLNKQENSDNYLRSKIFISIPETDATSISLLEAMAAGCIPVLSNIPANTEWVIDSLNGIIMSSFSDDIFIRALNINASTMLQVNTFLINEKGTKKINRQKFIDLYERILYK